MLCVYGEDLIVYDMVRKKVVLTLRPKGITWMGGLVDPFTLDFVAMRSTEIIRIPLRKKRALSYTQK
jgi:hypothetical protein